MTAPYPYWPIADDHGSMVVEFAAPDHTNLHIIVPEDVFGTETMHAMMRKAAQDHMATVDALRNQPGERP